MIYNYKGTILISAALWSGLALALTLSGCGGGGGGDDETQVRAIETPAPVPPLPTTMTCAHDGDMWFCNEEDSCVRDESKTEEVIAMEEVEPAPTAELDVAPVDPGAPVIQPLREFWVKFSSGNITIIAECGSNVTFNVSESQETVTPNGVA